MDIVENEYARDKNLKREEVRNLMTWSDLQPHLPEMTEHEVICFLKSCYYSSEQTKITIDNFFTMRTHDPDIFRTRTVDVIKDTCKEGIVWILSQKNPAGDSVLLIHHKDKDPSNFVLPDAIKLFDSIVMLGLKLNGSFDGLIIIMDLKNAVIGHLARLSVMHVKKLLSYLQEALPVRLKAIHFINTMPIVEAILAIGRPFMKREFVEMIHLHKSTEGLMEFVPLDILPSDYGGKEESLQILQGKMVDLILKNEDLLKYQESQLVNESLRPGKARESFEHFGTSGTFKKLELD